jgi:hypothetical protein
MARWLCTAGGCKGIADLVSNWVNGAVATTAKPWADEGHMWGS